ncbi:MAG: YncE family protein, partial [Acidobacteria bacterium]|nr:YncE family protein [Acidobacteriota bacterium]
MRNARLPRALAGMLSAFCFVLASPVTGQTSAERSYFVYVAAESDDTVDLVRFGPGGGELLRRIPVGILPSEIEGPHGVKVSPDGRHWYVSIAHGMPYGTVHKFETGTDLEVGDTTAGLFPATMDISPATGFLFVVNFNLHGDHVPSNVSVIDTVSMTEIAQIEQGVMPHGSRIGADGMLAYSVAMMSAELFEIDTMTFQTSRRMRLTGDNETTMAVMDGDPHAGHAMGGGTPASPTWVQPAPGGKHAYVALQGLNQVLEVDLEAWEPRRRFHTRRGPYNIDVSADGKHLVVTEKTNHSVGFWDLESGTERASVAASARITHGVVITPDSRFAIVTVEEIGGEPGRVEFYNLETLDREAVVEVGKQASGIAFW